MPEKKDFDEVRRLQDELEHLIQQESYAEALPIAQSLVNLVQRVFGEGDPAYDTSRENLAGTHFYLHQYHEASELFEPILRSREARLGKDHPDLADTLEFLTQCYYETGNYKAAESYVRQLLRIREKEGVAGSHVITEMGNLAVCLREQGKTPEAEKLLQRALEITGNTVGKRHTSYAFALNNFAFFLKSTGNYRRALPLYLEAIDILATQDVEKERYLITLTNLAALYDDLGDEKGATKTYQAIDSILDSSPHVGLEARTVVKNNQAQGHMQRGNYQAAKRSYQEALDAVRSLHGERHPRYATALSNLGVFHLHINDQAAAETLLQQALDIRRVRLGESSPEVAQTLNNLAELARVRGQVDRATGFLQQAIDVKRRAYRGPHPSLATSLNNLGHLYMMVGRWSESEKLLYEAIDCLRDTVGEQHPDYAQTLQNLGDLHKRQGNYYQAEPFFQQALSLLRDRFGTSFNLLLTTLNLAELYVVTGRQDAALDLLNSAVAVDNHMASQVFSVTSERQRMGFLEDMQIRDRVYLSLVLR